jgi:hypothetical protein
LIGRQNADDKKSQNGKNRLANRDLLTISSLDSAVRHQAARRVVLTLIPFCKEQEMEVSTVVHLTDPTGGASPEDFDIGIPKRDLPRQFWRETRDHVAGLFRQREEGSSKFELVRRMPKKEAVDAKIPCF